MGDRMTNRRRQSGLSILGFIFVAAVVLIFAMVGFRTLPSYIEYFTVKKVLAKTLEDAKEGFSMYEFRRNFDLKASADYIDSVRGSDVEVVKEGNALVATAAWSKTLHLVGNMSLLLEFEATATK
jgi:ribosomal protein S10